MLRKKNVLFSLFDSHLNCFVDSLFFVGFSERNILKELVKSDNGGKGGLFTGFDDERRNSMMFKKVLFIVF